MDKKSQLILFGISLFAIISILFSCEKDDLCADQDITPYLIINFVDEDDEETLDDVLDLQIEYISEDGAIPEFVFSDATTTDSITLSLPTTKDSARFVFKQNFDDDNPEDLSDVEIDTVDFFYERSEEYINRACGFRTTYDNLRIEVTAGIGNNVTRGFITNVDIENITIENEDEAHVLFAH